MNSLAGHRLPAGRDMPFGGQIRPGLCAFGGDPPVLAKGTPPFLEALPETFNRTGGWVFMSDFSAVRGARCPAETSRCTPSDLDRTVDNPAMIFR